MKNNIEIPQGERWNSLKVRGVKPENIGKQIIFVPSHLEKLKEKKSSWEYPNGIQPGFINGVNVNETGYFCRYWRYDPITEMYVPELRTLANSELTHNENLYFLKFFDKQTVEFVFQGLQILQNEGSVK